MYRSRWLWGCGGVRWECRVGSSKHEGGREGEESVAGKDMVRGWRGLIQANLQTFQCILHQHASLDPGLVRDKRKVNDSEQGDTPVARASLRDVECVSTLH